MAPSSDPPTYTPAHVAAAFFIKPAALRSWHALDGNGLITDADGGATLAPGIKRRYSLADAIRIGMVVRLSGADGGKLFNLSVTDAVGIANALRDTVTGALVYRQAGSDYEWFAIADRDNRRRNPWRVQVFASRAELAGHIAAHGVPLANMVLPLQNHIDAGVAALTRPGIADMSGPAHD